MRDDHKAGLERLGVLIGRTRSQHGERTFVVLDHMSKPQVPQSMIETQPLAIVHFPTILAG